MVMIWSSLCLEFYLVEETKRVSLPPPQPINCRSCGQQVTPVGAITLAQGYLWDIRNAGANRQEPIRPGFISAMQRLHQLTNKEEAYLKAVFKLDELSNVKRKRLHKQLLRDLQVRARPESRVLCALLTLAPLAPWPWQVYNELFFFPPHLRRRAYTMSILVSVFAVLLVAVRGVARRINCSQPITIPLVTLSRGACHVWPCVRSQVSVVLTLALPPMIFGDATFMGVVIHSAVSGVSQGVIIPVLNAIFRK